MATTHASLRQAPETLTWQPSQPSKGTKHTFNEDDVIHAFETGIRKGFDNKVNEIGEGLKQALNQNKSISADLTFDVLATLKDGGFEVVDALLKINSWSELDVLVLVKEEDFLRPEFDEVYTLAHAIEKATEKKGIFLSYSFAPHNEFTDMTVIQAEGYGFTHKVKNEKAAREQMLQRQSYKKKK